MYSLFLQLTPKKSNDHSMQILNLKKVSISRLKLPK